ncbi:MAG: DNRLRE domain-containing protein [bacterium]
MNRSVAARILTVGIVVALASGFAGSASASAFTLTLSPSQDNTIYNSLVDTLSNGSGQYIFSGRTALGDQRRALIAFDLSSIPPGSTITSAALTLHLSRSNSGPVNFELRKLATDWGEGASDADSAEGQGAQAAAGDATWFHTFYDTQTWTTAGGDFSAAVSSTNSVDSIPSFETWPSTAQMAADVQGWLDAPSTNFGWLVRVAQGGGNTAKRFESRDNPDLALRPRLVVDFDGPTDVPGGAAVAAAVTLLQNAPNPLTPRAAHTMLTYALPRSADVKLTVHDAAGRALATLVSGVQPAGWHQAAWDGHTRDGRRAPTGVYFSRLEAGGEVRVRKMNLVR